jgi:hypothetical protein
VVLAAGQCEPVAHFQQEALDLGDQSALDVGLGGPLVEPEPLEQVRALGEALREVGLRRRQRAVEVRQRAPLALVQLGLDLADQHVA